MSTVAAFYLLAQDVTAERNVAAFYLLAPASVYGIDDAATEAARTLDAMRADTRTTYAHLHNHADAPGVTAGDAYDALAAHVDHDDDGNGYAPVAREDAAGPLRVWALGASGGARESRHATPLWAFYRAAQLTRTPGAWSVVVTVGDAVRATWDSVDGWGYAGGDAQGDRARVIAADSIAYDYR